MQDPADRNICSKQIRILKMDSPKGRPRRQKELFKKVRILKSDSPEGETPQAEKTLQPNPRREDPTFRKSLYLYHIHIYIYIYINKGLQPGGISGKPQSSMAAARCFLAGAGAFFPVLFVGRSAACLFLHLSSILMSFGSLSADFL